MSQAEAGPSFWVRKYEKGFKDVWFVMTGILIFTVLRALVVRHLLAPLASVVIPPAKRTNSRVEDAKAIRQRRRMCMRFAEQAWIVIWGTVSLGLSLFVASREPYWGSELALWTDWPYRQLTGLTKFYYLLQTAFWVQQVIVINVEDRRKDHWQMFTHHIVTILLLFGSYVSHFTPIGNVILILMDPCDILLAVSTRSRVDTIVMLTIRCHGCKDGKMPAICRYAITLRHRLRPLYGGLDHHPTHLLWSCYLFLHFHCAGILA